MSPKWIVPIPVALWLLLSGPAVVLAAEEATDPAAEPAEANEGADGDSDAEPDIETESDPPSAEDRGALEALQEHIQALEARVAELERERASGAAAEPNEAQAPPPAPPSASSSNPAIAVVADVALAWFSDDGIPTLGAHDPDGTGLHLQQLEISLGHAVDPFFRLDANVAFSGHGVEIEEAYATTLGLPAALQFRVGQFLTRVGRFNPTHLHRWDFVDQPFAIGRLFGGEGNRGIGAEGSVLLPLPWSVELLASGTTAALEGQHGHGEEEEGHGEEGADEPTAVERHPLDLQATVGLRQFFPFGPDWSLAWGLSFASAPNPSGPAVRTEVYATDLYLKYRPISSRAWPVVALHAEWLYRRFNEPDGSLWDLSGFAQLLYRMARRWSVAARYEHGTATRSAAGIHPDPAHAEWTDQRHRGALALSFWPSEFSRIRLQGNLDLAGWRGAPVWAALLAFEFGIGAHGAHAF
jgi:hypothetical protein